MKIGTAFLGVIGVLAVAGGASAQGLFSPGGLFGGPAPSAFWQGSWGIEGKTPVVTVQGSNVSYEGVNRQTFAVSNVAFPNGNLSFQVGDAAVALTKRSDMNADLVSTISGNSSKPITLCKGGAAQCP